MNKVRQKRRKNVKNVLGDEWLKTLPKQEQYKVLGLNGLKAWQNGADWRNYARNYSTDYAKTRLKDLNIKPKNDIIKEKIAQAVKDIGIKCEPVNYPPKPININDFPFDNIHANEERNHDVTAYEAKSFVKNAIISLTRFNNTYENYYSLDGISYVNIKENYIRTAYKEKDYDERTKKIMEVLKQYAKESAMSNNK